jgi:hypothetical protein
MSRRLRFDAAAERELNEAVDFYDLESPGLGDVFLAEVEHSLAQVEAFPRRRSRSVTESEGTSCTRSRTLCSTRSARKRSASSLSRIRGAGRSTGTVPGECG